jgi:hypothetical protein
LAGRNGFSEVKMSRDELLARYSVQALRTAAEALGVDPLTLSKRLQDGEIARLMRLLNAALPHLASAGLRHRTEDLLTAVTGGKMPMFEKPESEFDWAMETLRHRRRNTPDDDGAEQRGVENTPEAGIG